MANGKMKPEAKLQTWIDARKRHGLSDAQVQMVRELGMNPKSLRKLDNHKQEAWKAPLKEFIADLYFKRFGREAPEVVLSLEEIIRRQAEKKEQKREKKLLARQQAAGEQAGRDE